MTPTQFGSKSAALHDLNTLYPGDTDLHVLLCGACGYFHLVESVRVREGLRRMAVGQCFGLAVADEYDTHVNADGWDTAHRVAQDLTHHVDGYRAREEAGR